MFRSTLKIALNLVFFSISAISYAQDASFHSDESYITADELPAVSGLGVYWAPGFPMSNGAKSPPLWWAPLGQKGVTFPSCVRLSDNLVMPVTGEVRAEITLVTPSAVIPTGTNPAVFTFELIGRDLSGNEHKVAALPFRPLDYAFVVNPSADGDPKWKVASLKSLLNVSFSGNNSAPLVDVHLIPIPETRSA